MIFKEIHVTQKQKRQCCEDRLGKTFCRRISNNITKHFKYQTLQHAYPRDFRKFSGKEGKHVVNFSAKVNMANSEADQHIILKQTLVENLAATLSFNPQERVIAEEQIKILEVNDSK